MKPITRKMLRIYKPYSNLDWLNYKLIKKDVTFHHIVKRCDGGEELLTNGAILMPVSHEYLHIIEFKEIEIYNVLNEMFKVINKQGYEPTDKERTIIEYMLLEFEDKHDKDRNAKGKLLIKDKYKRRWGR